MLPHGEISRPYPRARPTNQLTLCLTKGYAKTKLDRPKRCREGSVPLQTSPRVAGLYGIDIATSSLAVKTEELSDLPSLKRSPTFWRF
jgi:hypothetical protein